MAAAINGMPTGWRLFGPACIDPGDGGRQHTKVQVVADRLRMAGLRFGTADVVFQFLEQGFDFPAGTIILNDLSNGQG
jgi:hypothetical protein